jgi:hypothetical protein
VARGHRDQPLFFHPRSHFQIDLGAARSTNSRSTRISASSAFPRVLSPGVLLAWRPRPAHARHFAWRFHECASSVRPRFRPACWRRSYFCSSRSRHRAVAEVRSGFAGRTSTAPRRSAVTAGPARPTRATQTPTPAWTPGPAAQVRFRAAAPVVTWQMTPITVGRAATSAGPGSAARRANVSERASPARFAVVMLAPT